MRNAISHCALMVAMTAAAIVPARAQQPQPPAVLAKATITQRLNQQVPVDLEFRDEAGRRVRLGDFLGNKPIVLALVYFECPALCTEVLNGQLRTMKAISLDLGKDFEAIAVSFEPRDSFAVASAKRDVYAGQYGRAGAAAAWHFLTGDPPAIQALTEAVGYGYAYDEASKQYAHPAAVMILTPDGRMARYFYGVQYPARDFRLALVEASRGKIGSLTDHALLYCYQYDPATGKYGLVIMNVIRGAALLTVVALVGLVMVLQRQSRKRIAQAAKARLETL